MVSREKIPRKGFELNLAKCKLYVDNLIKSQSIESKARIVKFYTPYVLHLRVPLLYQNVYSPEFSIKIR
jgi:hypothetical protein